MQREIKKKTITYGVAAVLLVSILAATIYNAGVQINPIPTVFSELKTFSSFEELENFINTNMEKANQNEKLYAFDVVAGPQRVTLSAQDATNAAPEATVADYSTTNIQVAGVDEADIVKSDGEYLYVVSESTIYILKAYPYNEARLVSKITLDQTYGAQIYVSQNKLVVLTDQPFLLYRDLVTTNSVGIPEISVDSAPAETTNSTPPSVDGNISTEDMRIAPYFYSNEISLKVYDITDKANPVLSRTVILNGTLSGSRMIGNYVYAVANQPATQPNPDKETGVEVVLPKISGNHTLEVQPDEIRYIDIPDQFYYLTTIIAVDVMNDATEPTYEAFLTSQTTNMYVSQDNMYLVAPNTSIWFLLEDESESKDETLIYRVKLDNQNIVVEAEGSVTGFVLDQFSMDEHNGYFRIATTEWSNRWTDEGFTSNSTNSLFVLDMDMNIVGKLENLAPGESIYATRFMGDKVYLVTFRQIDPFFVIDTSDPTQPTVLGYLKIPGFSGYLHPYDENYIIGIGQEDNNLKLSLFDVTDVTAPAEKAKYVVEADWSDSTALWDHKAFLFDKAKNLLAIPVTVNTYGVIERIENGTIEDKEDMIVYDSNYYQGAYIFDVTVEQGFTLDGNVTHYNNADPYIGSASINRILYIDNVLYTISDKMVKMNNLESLEPLTEIQLS